MSDERHPLDYRDPELVAQILGHIYETDNGRINWLELIDQHTTGRHPWRTVEATIYDLLAFGALHKVGKATRGQPDTRQLRATPLGRAWLDRQLLPLPNERNQRP